MENQIPIIPLKDLNLTSRFLFNEVMEDPQAHRDVLSIIFGREVSLLSHNETEKELADFLHYVEDTTSERAGQSGSARIRRIQERVLQVKASEEMRVKYMQAWEERYYDRQEGWEEGHAAGHASGLAEGHASGLAEGHAAGQREMLESMVARKKKKGKSEEEIAEELETDPSLIREILAALAAKNDK